MTDGIVTLSEDIGGIVIQEPTAQLRFVVRAKPRLSPHAAPEFERILQQRWSIKTQNSKRSEWRDVPVVHEE